MTTSSTLDVSKTSETKPPGQPLRETPAQQITKAVLEALTPELQAISESLKHPPQVKIPELSQLLELVQTMPPPVVKQVENLDIPKMVKAIDNIASWVSDMPNQIKHPEPVNLTTVHHSLNRVEKLLTAIDGQTSKPTPEPAPSGPSYVEVVSITMGGMGIVAMALWWVFLLPIQKTQAQQNEILCSFKTKAAQTLPICQQ